MCDFQSISTIEIAQPGPLPAVDLHRPSPVPEEGRPAKPTQRDFKSP
jgi:hypothetical protein